MALRRGLPLIVEHFLSRGRRFIATGAAELDKLPLEYIRNFGISAHVDSGKTTLTERILFYTGMIDAIHEVQGSDGVGAKMDSMELERERGITIQAAATFTRWNLDGSKYHFNIIDTPGHVDFQIEVERSLKVLDGAILVVCGVHGVQSQTYTVDRQMRRYGVPRICMINKLDKAMSDPWSVVELIRRKLRITIVPVQVPIGTGKDFQGTIDVISRKAYIFCGEHGEKMQQVEVKPEYERKVEEVRSQLVEILVDLDEEFGDLYLSGGWDDPRSIRKALRRMTVGQTLVPCLFGSARGNKGVQILLNAVCDYLPHPGERPISAFKASDELVPVNISIDPTEKFVAMAFKIQQAEVLGILTYIKIYQGILRKGASISLSPTKKKLQWKRMYRMHSNESEEISVARAGDIVAISGLDVVTGATICDESLDVAISSMFIPETVISMAIAVVGGTSQSEKFMKAIKRFQKEDPTFRVNVDEESKEIIMSGMGELHLDIYVERMKREYGVSLKISSPKVNLREVIILRHDFVFTHKRQHGGRGEWARITGYFEPIDPEVQTLPKSEFVNKQVGGGVPINFVGSLRKGFGRAILRGPLTGSSIMNLRFVLLDGETHEIDSSDLAFINCMLGAFREHLAHCGLTAFEPVMKIEIIGPIEFSNNVQLGVSKKGLQINGVETEADVFVIQAEAPLRLMFGFIADLRMWTKGFGEFSMDFSHYRALDAETLKKAIEDYGSSAKKPR